MKTEHPEYRFLQDVNNTYRNRFQLIRTSFWSHSVLIWYPLEHIKRELPKSWRKIMILILYCHWKELYKTAASQYYRDLLQDLSSFPSFAGDSRPSYCNFPKSPIIAFISYNNQWSLHMITCTFNGLFVSLYALMSWILYLLHLVVAYQDQWLYAIIKRFWFM